MRLSPLVFLLLTLPASAQEGIAYRDIPAESGDAGAYLEIPAGELPPREEEGFVEIPAEEPQERGEIFVEIRAGVVEDSQNFVEVAPDRFSGGSRDGRNVYREMDHDDLDSEPMVEVSPAENLGRRLAVPTVVPVDGPDANSAVVVPVDRISWPEPAREDRIFRQMGRVPPAPGALGVPDQERVYISPGQRAESGS